MGFNSGFKELTKDACVSVVAWLGSTLIANA